MSDEKDDPASLDEARQARALAEALEGRGEGDLLDVASRIAAAREPALSASAKARIEDELFAATQERRPSRWPFALAASLLVGISVALVARERIDVAQTRKSEQESTHAAAEALVAALLPGDPAGRAQAIADGALQ